MAHTDWFVQELLSFLGTFPIVSMQVHSGVARTSVDLICSEGARVVGLPPNYLRAVQEEGLLPDGVEIPGDILAAGEHELETSDLYA